LERIINIYRRTPPIALFAIQGVLFYLVFLLFYKVLRQNGPIDAFYDWATLHLTNSYLWANKGLFALFGYEAEVLAAEKIIILKGTNGIFLDRGCLGRNLMVLFAGFIVVFPGSFKSKLWFVPAGLLVVYILNALRIFFLGLVQYHHPDIAEKSFEMQHDIFNYIVYVFCFLMWAFWIKRYGRTEPLDSGGDGQALIQRPGQEPAGS